MKSIIFQFLIIFLFEVTTYGQWDLEGNYFLNFDNANYLNHLTIDSLSNPNNIWIIGQPNKNKFLSAYSSPNVIITDTSQSYPINDTSRFIITNTALGGGFERPHTVYLGGRYNVDSDTISDFGLIEFSPNNGITWLDIINDTFLLDTNYQFYWYWELFGDKPELSGNSGGWKYFWVGLAELGHTFNVEFGDTVLYRFSFISDSIDSKRDGLMYDDLHFEDWVEGISNPGFELFKSRCSPNPTSNDLIIEIPLTYKSHLEVFIFESSSRILYHKSNITDTKIMVPTKLLSEGLYYYKVLDSKNKRFSIGKFIKAK